MDEMKIKINTKIMKGLIARLVSKTILDKIGVKPDISINSIDVETVDGKVTFHVDVNGSIDQNDLLSTLLKLNRVIDKE